MHVLDENVRQHNPGERRALEQLRAGDVEEAVAWYARNQRITVASTRDDALNAMVNAWMSDTRSGLNSGLYAWRRDNVAALNTAARTAWAADGRLNGPELEAPGGRRYAAGDRIVTLAPGAGGAIVTSERGTVTAVDPDRRQLVARMDDGRDQLFAAEDMTADRLDYGYATTVHRAQGATVDVAHRFHDGGGRELAYVAMSRARHTATVHVVADDVDQAVRRPPTRLGARTPAPLGHRHRHPRNQRPARRTLPRRRRRPAPQPAPGPPDRRTHAGRDAARTRSRPIAVPHPASPAARPRGVGPPRTGSRPFDDPELTAAAHTLNAARNRRALAERTATAPGLNRRGRRRWQREAAASRAAEHDATNAWTALAEPRRRHLTDEIHRLEESLRSLPTQPRRDRLAELDPSLEPLVRTVLAETGRHTPQPLDLGRSLPRSQRPNDTPDLGLEL